MKIRSTVPHCTTHLIICVCGTLQLTRSIWKKPWKAFRLFQRNLVKSAKRGKGITYRRRYQSAPPRPRRGKGGDHLVINTKEHIAAFLPDIAVIGETIANPQVISSSMGAPHEAPGGVGQVTKWSALHGMFAVSETTIGEVLSVDIYVSGGRISYACKKLWFVS